ncbi:MAG: accessory factor UbiK family protein [Acetobacteraceae bacterium]|nr:accessory factor UbiK family protein [Acetobacteraceae bacterium]
MSDRPKFFDDLAGVAGGAISALGGIRDEFESVVRSWIDDAVRRLELVRREDMEAVQQMAAKAREEQEKAEQQLSAALIRIAGLETRVTALEAERKTVGGTP